MYLGRLTVGGCPCCNPESRSLKKAEIFDLENLLRALYVRGQRILIMYVWILPFNSFHDVDLIFNPGLWGRIIR